jgi:hypothetical protein
MYLVLSGKFEVLVKESASSGALETVGQFQPVGLYKLNPVVTHSLTAPGFNP